MISALRKEARKCTNSGIFKRSAFLLKQVVLTSHEPLPVTLTPNSTWRCKGV